MALKVTTFQYLLNLKDSHSKTRNLAYSDLSLQDYLKPSCIMSIKEKSFIFSARCRMIEVKCNFKTGKTDLSCRKCKKEPESQQHILDCPELLKKPSDMDYLDLFGKNLDKLISVGKHLRKCLNLVINLPNVHSSDVNRAGAATLCRGCLLQTNNNISHWNDEEL